MKHITLIAAAVALVASCGPKTAPVPGPTMGWSSWNAFMTEISDSIICSQADIMVSSGLADAGYDFVNIDDGYFGGRDETGKLLSHPVRFPNGMRVVVDHIHDLGLKAGIYSDVGDNTCGSGFNHDTLGFGVGMYGHDEQDAQLFFDEWDFDFIKVDFCGGNHLQLDAQERYTAISEAIHAVNPDVVFNVCRWAYPGTWVHDISDSWRISGDIRPTWSRIDYCVRRNMYLSAYAWGGHYNDMDMLAVGYNGKRTGLPEDTALTFEEEEAHFGMWCIMSSPLLIGCDMGFIPPETYSIITNPELIAIDQDPLGLQAYVVQHEGEGYVFVKDILKAGGRTRAVALYNPSEEQITFSVPAEVLSLSGRMKVRDLTRREDLAATDCITMTLAPHNARILKVEGRRIQQAVYEAEWGYCPVFSAKSADGGKYMPREGASCGAVVTGIGGSEDNKLEWRDVRVAKAGTRTIELTLFPEESGSAVISVGGKAYPVEFAPAGEGEPVTVAVEAQFLKGANAVAVSSEAILPPIDRISIN